MMETKTQRTALASVQSPRAEIAAPAISSAALILDVASMDSIMRLAEFMAKGRTTIPDHFKGSPADCAAVIMQAIQWRMNPYAVAQKTHIVNGTLGYEAQLVNSAIQSSGVTLDRFAYEWFGPWEKIIGKTKVKDVAATGKYGDKDYKKAYQYRIPDYQMQDEEGLGVRISATLRGEQRPRVLELLLVQASVRNSPLWATDPKQQLAYLAVKRWSRLYSPDVILGVYSNDELEEFSPVMVDITPAAQPAPAAAAALPDCSDEQFAKNSAAWRDLIVSKKKTPATLIAMLSTRGVLTEEQKLTIDSWAHENE
jgi:hypothetical protein